MTNMQIIDNFLSDDQWKKIHEVLDGDDFPWYLNKDTSYDGKDNYRATIHTFYTGFRVNSDWFNLVEPLIIEFKKQTSYKLQSVLRMKANLSFNRLMDENTKQKIIHQDMVSPNYISLLYYIHDSDGDTILYQDDKETEATRITPKANRAVVFDSRIWHTGELPTINQTRAVVSSIFQINGLCSKKREILHTK